MLHFPIIVGRTNSVRPAELVAAGFVLAGGRGDAGASVRGFGSAICFAQTGGFSRSRCRNSTASRDHVGYLFAVRHRDVAGLLFHFVNALGSAGSPASPQTAAGHHAQRSLVVSESQETPAERSRSKTFRGLFLGLTHFRNQAVNEERAAFHNLQRPADSQFAGLRASLRSQTTRGRCAFVGLRLAERSGPHAVWFERV